MAASLDSFKSRRSLTVGGETYDYFSLTEAEKNEVRETWRKVRDGVYGEGSRLVVPTEPPAGSGGGRFCWEPPLGDLDLS